MSPGLIGLDLNTTRARAVGGPAGAFPSALPLDGSNLDLPVALSLEGRQVQAGQPGLALCRRLPHLACLDFLPHLGTDRIWTAGKHRLDAARALAFVLEHLKPAWANAQGLALAIPTYLAVPQLDCLRTVATRVRLPLIGTVAVPLALALTAHTEQPWTGLALAADVDDHALTWAAILVEDGQARLLAAEPWPLLGLRFWRERLLNVLSDRCVRQSRRDPRDSADAEQALYEQIEPALEVCGQGQLAEVAVQTTQWYQNLIVQPGELIAACASLARQTLDAMRALQTSFLHHGPAGAVLLSSAAAHLPGLTATVEACVGESAAVLGPESTDDFGEALVEGGSLGQAAVYILPADAAARAAHAVAVRWQQGEVAPGHFDAARLLPPPPPDAGPPRLHFQGQDFLLGEVAFTLGRHPDNALVFESALYPGVSAHHCEIVFDGFAFILWDRSRNGTLVNERLVFQQTALHPGDWIRLGPGGPLLRFLGQVMDQRRLSTTA
jgi:hypothetical protein